MVKASIVIWGVGFGIKHYILGCGFPECAI